MASKNITERSEPRGSLPDWTPAREAAPSILREDEPNVARILALVGLCLIVFGAAVIATVGMGRVPRVNPALGALFIVLGKAFLVFHASRETDRQIRRAYGLWGYLLLAAGILVVSLPIRNWTLEFRFLPMGFTAFALALLFLLPFGRNETEESWRRPVLMVLGIGGAALGLTGFIGGNIHSDFLLPHGMLLVILGLAYAWAFVGLSGTAGEAGYKYGLAMGGVGALAFLAAVVRSLITTRGASTTYFAQSGALLMGLGVLWMAVSAGLCSDNRLVVMTRRELAGFFYSPIAYIVFFCMTVVGWFLYWMFIGNLAEASQPSMRGAGQGLIEPIVQYYIFHLVPVVSVLVVVPAITMRLLSEEKRTGTLEVLLTAPLGETAIVLSKFFAALIFFVAIWIPWGLFLIALRFEGGQPFDYGPLLSFFLALTFTGAGFLGMGLFFSSLTRNQIAAFILTFMGLMLQLCIYFIVFNIPQSSDWSPVWTHASYIHFWQSSLTGKLFMRSVLFHLSATVFWLFLTIKVLEARKWK